MGSTRRYARQLGCSVLLAVAAPAPLNAQIVMDGSTGVAAGLTGPAYAVHSNTGTLAGDNLFHSFDSFALTAGQSATWSSSGFDSAATPIVAANINNIINRVTGGAVSTIDGTIVSTAYANADFYFINPAGVIFNENALVSTAQSFYVSTADELRFVGGSALRTDGANNTFVSAAPEAFGFFGGAGGDITMNGTVLSFSASENMGFVAENFTTVDSYIGHLYQYLDFVAVGAGANTVPLSDFVPTTTPTGELNFSLVQLVLTGSAIYGPTGQALRMQAGTVLFGVDDALHEVGGFGPYLGHTITDVSTTAANDVGGATFDITATTIHLDDTANIYTYSITTENAGDISVTTDTLLVEGGADLISYTDFLGSSGSVTVNASSDVTITGTGSSIRTQLQSVGATGVSGDVTINADTILIEQNGFVHSHAYGGGNGGNVFLSASDIQIRDGHASSSTSNSGNAGSVSLVADSILIDQTGKIGAWAFGSGNAGSIVLSATDISIDGSSLEVTAAENGDGGSVTVSGGDILFNNANVDTRSTWAGNSGSITIGATSLTMSDGDLNVSTDSSGDAGTIAISASSVLLDNLARISLGTSGSGSGGALSVSTGSFTLLSDAEIYADASSTGTGGSISIDTTDLVISDGIVAATSVGSGSGGSIDINATASILLDLVTIIDARTYGVGQAGTISLSAIDVQILGGTGIEASTNTSGNAGSIAIAATTLEISDSLISVHTLASGHAGSISIDTTGAFNMDNGTLYAFSSSDANAGTVAITAGNALILNNSVIHSGAIGTGNAGLIDISATSLTVSNANLMATTQDGTSGGTVNITADSILFDTGAAIQGTTYGSSPGGVITVTADTLQILGISGIYSNTNGSGHAGSIAINASNITVNGASVIESVTSGSGDAGAISISASSSVLLDNDARISLNTSGGGSGGALSVSTGTFSLLSEADIYADASSTGNAGSVSIVATGAVIISDADVFVDTDADGNAGTISISAQTILMYQSSDLQAATSGDGIGGSITLGADDIQIGDNSSLSSSSTGTGAAGSIIISATDFVLDQEARIFNDSNGSGNGGLVDITATTILMDHLSNISSTTVTAQGGSVSLDAEVLEILHGSGISAYTLYTGHAGNVVINAGDLLLDQPGPGVPGSTINSGISTATYGQGDAGNITINATRIRMGDSTFLHASSEMLPGNPLSILTNGSAGLISITADSMEMDAAGITETTDTPYLSSILSAVTNGSDGDSGGITINITGELSLRNGANIHTLNTGSTGDPLDPGSNIAISAGSLIIAGNSSPDGPWGALESAISTSSHNPDVGAGDIQLNVGRLEILDGGLISARSYVGEDAGTISITGDELLVSGVSSDGLTARLSVTTLGTGDAGTMEINVADVQVLKGGQILSNTFGAGNAGIITICCADTTLVSGPGSIITASALDAATGDAGLIIVKSSRLVLDDGGKITVGALSTGRGGAIVIKAHSVTLRDTDQDDDEDTEIKTVLGSSATAGGDGGNIVILAGDLNVSQGAAVTTLSQGSVAAGNIDIRTSSLVVTGEGSNFSSTATGVAATSDAGTMTIGAVNLELTDGAALSTSSTNGNGGNITLGVDDTLTISNAVISTSIGGAGNDGNIVIGGPVPDLHPETDYCGGLCEGFDPFLGVTQNSASDGTPTVTILAGSNISTKSAAGGEITITADIVIDSQQSPSQVDGSSPVTVQSAVSLEVVVAAITESLSVPEIEENNERVSEQASEETSEEGEEEDEVEGVVMGRRIPYLKAFNLLQERCALQRTGVASVLINTVDGIDARTDGAMGTRPAFYADPAEVQMAEAGADTDNDTDDMVMVAMNCQTGTLETGGGAGQ